MKQLHHFLASMVLTLMFTFFCGIVYAQPVCTTLTGTVSATDPTTSLRSFRDAVSPTCATPKTCTAGIAGTFQYKVVTWTNPSATAQCVTVTNSTTSANFSFVAAYTATPTLTNLCTNWASDGGTSPMPGTPSTFSFNVAGSATIYFLITNVTGGQTIDYSIAIAAPICGAATAPSVTINQAAPQADPTAVSPINFTVVFSEAVTGFTAAGVTLSGTAGATTKVVTGGPTTYNVAVSGMTGSGTVIATVPAGAATGTVNVSANTASTSTDNTVTYNAAAAGVCTTLTGTVSATDPSTSLRNFRDAVSPTCATPKTCTAGIAGTFQYKVVSWTNPAATAQCVTVTNSTTSANFSFVAAYTATPTLTNLCTNWASDGGTSPAPGTPSTFSFNVAGGATIYFLITNVTGGQTIDYSIAIAAPICGAATAPSVTINQAAAQADPTAVSPINFTVVFSEAVTGFTAAGVTLSGTAGATTKVVTGGPTTYNVAVSGMTGSGTVIATVPAGAATGTVNVSANTASTSTDNTVTYNAAAAGVCTTLTGTVSATDPSTSLRNFRDAISPTCATPKTCTAGIAGTFQYKVVSWTNPSATAQCVTVSNSTTSANFSFVAAYTATPTLTNLCTNWASDGGTSPMPGTPSTFSFNVAGGATIYFLITNVTGGQTVDYSIAISAPLCTAVISPSVTINQAATQTDPTAVSPINFTVVFSQPVTGFTAAGVTLSGTAGATTKVVTGGPTTYNVAVSGMTNTGTVIATVAANAATGTVNVTGNTASTSTDNTVTYTAPIPGVCTTLAGTVSATDPSTSLRNFRDAVSPTCATPKTCTAGIAGTFQYKVVTWTNPAATAQCVTVTNSTTSANFSFVAAYTATPTLTNLCTNWASDGGTSPAPGTPSTFSFNVAGGATIYFLITNITGGQTVDYSIAISAPICCTATVNPVANQSACSNAATTPITFTGAPAGVTFNWTNSNPSIGLPASGTGNIPSFTAINNSSAPVVATISVIPTSGTCSGSAQTFTITVNPAPAVLLTATNVSANSTTTNPALPITLFAAVSPAGNYIYSWTLNGSILPVLGNSITTANGLFNEFGTYQVTAINITTGCTAVSNKITVTDIPGQRNHLFITPNPTTGVVNVQFYSSTSAAQTRSISVFTSTGQRIINKPYSATGIYGNMQLDLSAYPAGTYMVVLLDATNKRIAAAGVVKY